MVMVEVNKVKSLSKLDRYTCDIEFDFDDEENANVVTMFSKNGQFVKWHDIELLIKKNK